ncbi:MAG: hypothetical protein SVS85_00125 [Candidatus Nanohaloarchaea archaeon]|nr:hypothetical protein [Candidatus Nanohaloarchaea archaeon]
MDIDVYGIAVRIEEDELSLHQAKAMIDGSDRFYLEGRNRTTLWYRQKGSDTSVEFDLRTEEMNVYEGDLTRFAGEGIGATADTPRLTEFSRRGREEEESQALTTLHLEMGKEESQELEELLEDSSFQSGREESPVVYMGEGWTISLFRTGDSTDVLKVTRDSEEASDEYDELLKNLEDSGTPVAVRLGEGLKYVLAEDPDSFEDLEEMM